MTGDGSSAGSYATATDNLRSAARWLLTAAAAAAAVMVAGLQLTSIGSLGPGDWPRLLAAVVGLAVGLGAVGYMIFQASLLLTDAWITLAEFVLGPFNQRLRPSRRDKRRADEIDRIRSELESYQDEYFGAAANSIDDLYHRLIEANKEARESPSPEHAQAAANVKGTVDTIVQAANYSYVRAEFAVLRRRLAEAGAIFVAAIVVFAFAANPPKPAAQNPAVGHAAVQKSPAPKATSSPQRAAVQCPPSLMPLPGCP